MSNSIMKYCNECMITTNHDIKVNQNDEFVTTITCCDECGNHEVDIDPLLEPLYEIEEQEKLLTDSRNLANLHKIVNVSNGNRKVYLYTGPNSVAEAAKKVKSFEDVLKEQLCYRTEELIDSQALNRDYAELLREVMKGFVQGELDIDGILAQRISKVLEGAE